MGYLVEVVSLGSEDYCGFLNSIKGVGKLQGDSGSPPHFFHTVEWVSP